MDDLVEFKPFITKAINAALPNMFEEVKGFADAPQIGEADLDIVDPKVENARVSSFSVLSIVTCAIIAFFLTMTMAATFLLWSKAQDTLRIQRNRQ